MATVFDRVWTYLSLETNIWDRFSFLIQYRTIIFSLIFGAALLVGYLVYQMYFSITFFYLFVTLTTILLRPYIAWNYVVAIFSVAGVIFTFLSYRWTRVGGLVLCAVIGAMCGAYISAVLIGTDINIASISIMVVFALVAFLAEFFLTQYTICIMTAVFGGFGLAEVFGFPLAGFVLAAGGAGLQIFLSRRADGEK